ncbi:MAG: sugar ABC transporter ATP-binding protein [Mesorhizobium sp.]|uniref:sugar ABC transporter ATP-binding protein n=1 Tax=unclassified Mesorhizobium TaxID=325217 RepID=UPI000FCA1106|nr:MULTISPECIES: sugar ABC transporter ATP-binding protein [unclassified Mesorhizobium]RUV71742.1 sugar ABC transporter ATP-binding protein [Mesorhizobium sp. M5C.F.Cr.IN.023.01.1.1]RWF84951.1 MAG: sugar ABC transporter ATP-binding protein [Mesorhizobium sp.]RWF96593.1 MAG: sugar ABC transporter ATP-binding protein [Mesorhizobium sp.]RWI42010.1 MAG: sugar ABC transporter ATP-binding protein [Mesorhizobium sp.]RWI51247.1 MAG: sugar ABC transporter ATP-binding protein [Mesorhizobium sp.]
MTAATDDDVILTLEDVSKVYSGTVAVKRANFEVRKGAVNVLVGENGAGKSTLMKIIAGVEQPTLGRIILEGEEVSFSSSGDAVNRGIGMVFQELNLFGNLTVAENIFATREITNRFRKIDSRQQERRAAEFLERLEAGIRPDMLVEDLRIGQQQLVEIAKAVSLDARILIMDEPTSALSAAEVEILFKVIADLKARGVAIVYISHRLEELIRIGDYITVLRDGRITGQEKMKNVDTQWIVRQMIGSDAKDFAKADGHVPGEEIFRAEDICLPRVTGGLAVDHVSLSLRAGEILGIYGLMGAGRSELFDCIMGRHSHATGAIFIAGKKIRERDTTRRIRRGLALIPEDRQREGLVSILSVASNLTLASLSRFVRLFHIRGAKENQAVTQMVRELAIKVANPAQEVSSLSGGNQQKVVIGKALLTGPKVLLMDEPSRGIDVGAKADVFRTMRKLSRDGLGILFATSDLDEVMALSDRIAVMSNGKLTGMFDRAEATEAALVAASALGHGPVPHTESHAHD